MKAFEYFLELTKIPRESFHEEKIANFICNQAKKLNLEYNTDKLHNVKIFKDNHSNKTIILQAHLDMVCEKLKNFNINFNTQGIKTIIQDDFIFADGTTLGADDGFGIALILEALENYGEGYPNIYAFFTTQEEQGMSGAKNIDCSKTKSTYMIGLDGTKSNELIISCAGSIRFNFEKDFSKENDNKYDNSLNTYKLSMLGLLGGHSGEDIDKHRANANKEIFKILNKFTTNQPIKLCDFCSNSKENAIPRECELIFQTKSSFNELSKILNDEKNNFKKIYPNETNATITLTNIEDYKNTINRILSYKNSQQLIEFIVNFHNGVIFKENQQVIFSINLANIIYQNDKIIINSMFRFNNKNYQNIIESYKEYGKQYGLIYNEWNFSTNFDNTNNNDFKEICEKAYYDCGYTNLKITNIHAGLEGGIFSEKIPNLKVVVLGADLFNIHTPNEKMRISSLSKLSKWLQQILLSFVKI